MRFVCLNCVSIVARLGFCVLFVGSVVLGYTMVVFNDIIMIVCVCSLNRIPHEDD